jgi:hypothetical protein
MVNSLIDVIRTNAHKPTLHRDGCGPERLNENSVRPEAYPAIAGPFRPAVSLEPRARPSRGDTSAPRQGRGSVARPPGEGSEGATRTDPARRVAGREGGDDDRANARRRPRIDRSGPWDHDAGPRAPFPNRTATLPPRSKTPCLAADSAITPLAPLGERLVHGPRLPSP